MLVSKKFAAAVIMAILLTLVASGVSAQGPNPYSSAVPRYLYTSGQGYVSAYNYSRTIGSYYYNQFQTQTSGYYGQFGDGMGIANTIQNLP